MPPRGATLADKPRWEQVEARLLPDLDAFVEDPQGHGYLNWLVDNGSDRWRVLVERAWPAE